MHRSLCICGMLPRLDTRTRVVLVLHQLEARKPTNTGALATRCLPNSAIVYRGRGPDRTALDNHTGPHTGPLVVPPLVPAGVQGLVLFPDPDAVPLETWRGQPVALIVPDGTWSQAAKTRRRLPELAGLPCVSLPPAAREAHRLRTPPRPGRLATLEAVAIALGILEGPAVEEALMRIFRTMTDRTLWTNGRIRTEDVTGGIPAGVQSHRPLDCAR